MVGCCIFRPLHPLSLLLRGLSSRCAVASHSNSLAPLVRLVVAPSLLTPPPPFCRCLRLSWRSRLSSRHGLPYLLSGWLLRRLFSRCRLPSASVSDSHRAIASRRAMASRASCPAGCRVASAAHRLGTSLPVGAPPFVRLLLSPAGCRVASRCATFATHPLDTRPPLSGRPVVPSAAPAIRPISSVGVLSRRLRRPVVTFGASSHRQRRPIVKPLSLPKPSSTCQAVKPPNSLLPLSSCRAVQPPPPLQNNHFT
jgi:hypothetical protein